MVYRGRNKLNNKKIKIMSKIDLGMDFQMPKNQSSQIKVMGIGGGGSNAVNYMFENGITGVDFVICNTDSQALEASPIPIKIQLGANLTEGLGAGSNPEIGRKAAEESHDKIVELLDANTKMLFLTAGMGGGTGTGAAPVIAEIAREKGILTVGVVTNPFKTEGGYRKQYAEEGVKELKKYVDTLLIINNDKLIEVYGDLTFTQAFAKANEILNTATKGIAEIISEHLLVNIDLNDARKVLENSGTAVMGQSTAEGENRAVEAVISALDSPLLNDNDIYGAQHVLLKIVTGDGDGEIRMSELSKIKDKIQDSAGNNVNIIEGIGIDPDLGNAISVTIIATGFEQKKEPKEQQTINLNDEESLDDFVENESADEFNIDSDRQHTLELEEIIEDNTINSETINESIVSDEMSDDNFNNEQDFSNIELNDSVSTFSNTSNNLNEVNSNSSSEQFYNKKQTNENKESLIDDNLSDNKIVFELDNEFSIKNIDDQNNNNIICNETENLSEQNENLNTIDKLGVDNETMKVESRERENRLREISQQLRTPSGLTNLEDIPAYKRNNIELQDTPHSSEDNLSTYNLSSDENNIKLDGENSFLHDNVD
ncbi:MAG: cell division protein FtsZ [Flavobacteriales bacterium]|nr:cell division protein FtsZ [Flavobacteriales bacterium]